MQKVLKSIVLHNYRSHADSTIEFASLTGITGLNNHGKTNVFKALNMILTNDNFRDKDVRRGTKEAYVILNFTDGSWIKRAVGKGEKALTLCDGVNAPIGYDKYSDMTDTVQAFTGFLDVKLDKTGPSESIQIVNVNAPQNFLIEKASAETILRRINRLAGGSGVDVAKNALEKKAKELARAKEQSELDVKAATDTVEKYATIDSESYRTAIKAVTDIASSITVVQSVVNKLVEVRPIKDSTVKLVRAKELDNEITKFIGELTTCVTELESLESDVVELAECSTTKEVGIPAIVALYGEEDILLSEITTLEQQLLAAKIEEIKQTSQEEEPSCEFLKERNKDKKTFVHKDTTVWQPESMGYGKSQVLTFVVPFKKGTKVKVTVEEDEN